MSWTFRSLLTVTNNGSTPPTISLAGSGWQVGDYCFAYQRAYNISNTLVTPQAGSGGAAYSIIDQTWSYQRLYGRVLQASEPDPIIAESAYFACVSFSLWHWTGGAGPAINSLVNASATSSTSGTTNYPFPALTPTVDKCLCLLFEAASSGSTGYTNPSAYPTRLDYDNPSVSGHAMTMTSNYVIQTTAAGIASGTITIAGGGSTVANALAIALNPGTTSGGGGSGENGAQMYSGVGS